MILVEDMAFVIESPQAVLNRITGQEEGANMNNVLLEKRTVRKVTWRLIPFLALLNLMCSMDKTNVSFAALEMNKDLAFTAEVFGFGAGIFFLGYVLVDIPGNLLLAKFGARKWITRILITWGIISGLTAFVHTPMEFYTVRFLLGMAEASFIPGVIYYLGNWFRSKEIGKVIAMFLLAQPVNSMIGAPLNTFIIENCTWLDMAGWQWLFIIEAVPSVLLGFVTFFFLTDKPEDAKWLNKNEQEWLVESLEADKAARRAKHGHYTLRQAFTDRDLILLVVSYFLFNCGAYGVIFFLPTIVKSLSSSFSNQTVGFLVMIPYAFAGLSLFLVGRHSDKTGERRWHIIICLLVFVLGLVGCAIFHQTSVVISMICITVALIGLYGVLSPYYSIPHSFLTASAAAGGIALLNTVGNFGGFVGPYAMGLLTKFSGTYIWGIIFWAGCSVVAAVLMMKLRKAGAGEVRKSADISDVPAYPIDTK